MGRCRLTGSLPGLVWLIDRSIASGEFMTWRDALRSCLVVFGCFRWGGGADQIQLDTAWDKGLFRVGKF